MKTNFFQSCGHCWVFQICWHIECSAFTASSFRVWNSSTGIPSPPLALFIVMLLKAHLTSLSRISGSRWVITPSWLSWSWRSFLYSSSVYSYHLFLISSVHLVKAIFFPVVMYGCESWTIKKAECRGIDAFELCCWRRLFRVPWTTRRSKQSILWKSTLKFTERTDAEVEDPILWPPHAKSWLIGKDPDAGKDWGQEEKGTTGWDG